MIGKTAAAGITGVTRAVTLAQRPLVRVLVRLHTVNLAEKPPASRRHLRLPQPACRRRRQKRQRHRSTEQRWVSRAHLRS